jgi:hypothetical protein
MERFFLVTLIITGALFIIQSFLNFFDIFDLDVDSSSIMSIRNIITFVLGLSVAGYIFVRSGYSLAVTVISAVVFAVLLTGTSIFLIKLIRKFEQHNTIESYEFRGLKATVTVLIEPNTNSVGKVEFMLNDRFDEKNAVTDEKDALHPGDIVRIERLLDDGSVLVSKTII